MKKLIFGTTAYATFASDVENNRLSHAYLLNFPDGKNLRLALKIFALKFFDFKDERENHRILNESFPDLKIYPEESKKFNVEAATELLADCALRPLESDKKLIVVSGFGDATPLVQNKLLKTLEEPYDSVCFLLGTTSLAPVLDTVKSRVKLLEISPFSDGEIYGALERKGHNPLNKSAAESCGGILGEAENMVGGGWFSEVSEAAKKICTTTDVGKVGELAIRYGDTKYKTELLSAISFNFHKALTAKVKGERNEIAERWQTPALIFAGTCADRACRDLKFNAFFQGLLYNLMLRIIEENDKWLKLRG